MGSNIGCAFDKLEEGFTWLIPLISQWIKSAFNTIKEACTWVISKIIVFFKILSNWSEIFLHKTKPFFDNFSEKFKEALLKSKNMIDRTVEKAASISSSIAQWFNLSSQELKLKLENVVTSLVENLKELFGHVKEYLDLVSEAAKKIGRRYKILSQIDDILFQFCRIFQGEGVEVMREIVDGFFKRNFKSLAEDEKTRAMLIHLCFAVLKCILQIIAKNFLVFR